MERTNVIELKYYQPAAPVCATRPARRSSRRSRWETLATAAEAVVTGAIGLCVIVCTLLFFTML